MASIYVIVSINMDVVVLTPRHPEAGETLFGHDVKFIPGGKGSNQAVAAGRLADGAALVGRLGEDAFGDALKEFLGSENLELHVPQIPDVPTGTALITVDDGSENRIIVVSGANMAVTPADLKDLSFTSGDIVVCVFEIPQETIKAAFEKARTAGATTVLNPAPAGPFIDGLHELCDVLVVNETELAFFTKGDPAVGGGESLRRQLLDFRSRNDQIVIATLGVQGAAYLDGEDLATVSGREVEAVDTTGAGDCFVGALAVALQEKGDLEKALAFANAAASLSVQKLGASASLPFRGEVDRVLGSAQGT